MENIDDKIKYLEIEINNNNYKESTNEFLKQLNNFKQDSEINIIKFFLNLILENYDLSNLHQYIKEDKNNLQKYIMILNTFVKNPYSNIKSLLDSLTISSEKIKKIISLFLIVYSKNQKVFIENYYSKISLSSLKKNYGDEFNEKLIEQYEWIKNKDYIIIPQSKSKCSNKSDYINLKKELEFLGKMNVDIEHLNQENFDLVDYEK